MQELFLSYRWPALWQQLLAESKLSTEQSLWKAALLAAWWQGGEQARRLMPPLKTVPVGQAPLPVFVTGLVALCVGDGGTLKQILLRLTKLKAPAWMAQWLLLEEAGRRRQFDVQARQLAALPANQQLADWPYIACLQSLDQKEIDPQPMLQVLSNSPELPALGRVLHARLLAASNQQDSAIEILKPLMTQGVSAAPAAAYHLGFAAAGLLDMTLALQAWDFAAQQGFMDRPSIEQWLSLSLSHPAGWASTPARVAHAIKLCAGPDMPDSERSAGALSSHQLIYEWIEGRFTEAYALVAKHHAFQNLPERPDDHPHPDRNAQVFFRYVLHLCAYRQLHQQLYRQQAPMPTLHCLGESHSLSPAHAVFEWMGEPVTGKSHFVMGIKMWHLASPEDNFYKTALRLRINALPKGKTILLCVGKKGSDPY